MTLAYNLGDYALAIVAVTIGLIPLGISVWALLDVARRPAWAWALADRDRVRWIASIAFTSVILGVGLTVAMYYLMKVRPHIDAIEQGNLTV